METIKIAKREICIIISLALIKELGIESSFLYCYLQYKHQSLDLIPANENEIKEDLLLSQYQQRIAFKNLEDLGYIKQIRIGLPAKRFINILK
jgi:hypothetical protein